MIQVSPQACGSGSLSFENNAIDSHADIMSNGGECIAIF
jgi:hypothetical protein